MVKSSKPSRPTSKNSKGKAKRKSPKGNSQCGSPFPGQGPTYPSEFPGMTSKRPRGFE